MSHSGKEAPQFWGHKGEEEGLNEIEVGNLKPSGEVPRSAFSKCHARGNRVYRPGVNHERLQRATSILTLQLP